MHRLPRPSPALIISLLALFFALGGTAWAVGSRAFVAQPRCAAGAVRGIAVVTGDPKVGIANLTEQWTSAASVFGYRWNCSGGQIMVRKAPNSRTGYDVMFARNAAAVAFVSSIDPNFPAVGSVSRNPDGSFHIIMGNGNQNDGLWQYPATLQFMIVAI
jgi:hypothetical protein